MKQKAPHALCSQCPLRHEHFVPSEIVPNAEIIYLGKAPGQLEVYRGKPFVGQGGQLLQACVEDAEHPWDNASRTNVVLCRPPENRDPTPLEIACCLPRLQHELENQKSSTIVALGKLSAATMALLSETSINTLSETYRPENGAQRVVEQQSNTLITKQRGAWTKWNRVDKAFFQTVDPAFVLRDPSHINTLREDIKKAYRGIENAVLLQPPTLIWIRSLEQLASELSKIPHQSRVVIDVETDGLQWFDTPTEIYDPLLMLGIAWNTEQALILDDVIMYDTAGVRELLQKFFDDMLIVAHNGKFDALVLKRLGIKISIYFDTMLAHYALDDTKGTHGLKHLATTFLGIHDYDDELVNRYLKSKKDKWSKVPPESLGKYLGWDVCTTYYLHTIFEERLKKEGLLEWPFNKLLMPAGNAFIDVEWLGIKIDVPYLERLSEVMKSKLTTLEQQLQHLAGMPTLNPNSPAQVSHVIYELLGLKQPRGRGFRAKEGSTSKEVLIALQGTHPFIDQLIEFRRIAKLRSSYCDKLPKHVDKHGRIHASFLVIGTEMGRISVRDPALQTIPRSKKDIWGAAIKAAFIAEEGYTLSINDYSQAELRALAHLSQEPHLLNAYREDKDLHAELAALVYGPNFTDEQRSDMKSFNFAWVYGGNEYSFGMDRGLPIDQAKAFVDRYESLMRVAVQWKNDQFMHAVKYGEVRSIFNRVRRFPLITNDNKDEVRKSSVHMLVSSPASDVGLLSAIDLINQGKRVTLMVHDSVISEVPIDQAEYESKYVSDTMVDTASRYMNTIPWKVDRNVQDRWYPIPETLFKQ